MEVKIILTIFSVIALPLIFVLGCSAYDIHCKIKENQGGYE